MESSGRYRMVKAPTPLAELERYSNMLLSRAQSERLHAYQPVPSELPHKLVNGHK